ncbi:cytochrome P450 [Tanacetum coccineum]
MFYGGRMVPYGSFHVLVDPEILAKTLLDVKNFMERGTSPSTGSSTPPRYSPGALTPQSYSPGTSRNAECSNCKHLFDKITDLRKKKVQELLNYVQDCSTIRKAATVTLNVLSNFIFSVDIAHYDSTSPSILEGSTSLCVIGSTLYARVHSFHASFLLVGMILEIMKIGGKLGLADIFPVLRPLDPQWVVRRSNPITRKLLAIFEKHINNRLEARAKRSSDAPSSTNDLTDLLLENSKNGDTIN